MLPLYLVSKGRICLRFPFMIKRLMDPAWDARGDVKNSARNIFSTSIGRPASSLRPLVIGRQKHRHETSKYCRSGIPSLDCLRRAGYRRFRLRCSPRLIRRSNICSMCMARIRRHTAALVTITVMMISAVSRRTV